MERIVQTGHVDPGAAASGIQEGIERCPGWIALRGVRTLCRGCCRLDGQSSSRWQHATAQLASFGERRIDLQISAQIHRRLRPDDGCGRRRNPQQQQPPPQPSHSPSALQLSGS